MPVPFSNLAQVGNPNADEDGTDGLLTALRYHMTALGAEAGQMEQEMQQVGWGGGRSGVGGRGRQRGRLRRRGVCMLS